MRGAVDGGTYVSSLRGFANNSLESISIDSDERLDLEITGFLRPPCCLLLSFDVATFPLELA